MASRPPNVIMIVTDQQRADTIAAAGHPHMFTPHLDGLAREGHVFSQCFSPGACCVPARAALYSGKYPHQQNLLSNTDWNGEDNWVRNFAAAGYQTVGIGKMHLHPWRAPCGFETRFLCENKNQPFKPGEEPDEWVKFLAAKGHERPLDYHRTMPDFLERFGDVEFPFPEEWHEDAFIGAETVKFLEQRDDTRPLFLNIGFAGPHDPFDAPRRCKDLYKDRPLPPAHALPDELAAKPSEQADMMRRHEEGDNCIRIRLSKAGPEGVQRLRAAYYAGVTFIDEWVGRILEALERRGLLENSIVVFTSDHGDALGDNGMIFKWFMYDAMLRVPLLVWSPGRVAAGRTEALVELLDVGPTLLELAGLVVPWGMPAMSLAPALNGVAGFNGKPFVYCEEKHLAMVRSAEWKLVHYHGRPYGELYDLRHDPHEHRNMYDAAEAAGVKAGLYRELEAWYARTGGRPACLQRYLPS